MAVGRLIKAGLTGVTVFLWILMAGLLTGCGSRSGEIAEETGYTKPEQLEEYLLKAKENIAFVYGKGKRKTDKQRQWEKLDAQLQRWTQ